MSDNTKRLRSDSKKKWPLYIAGAVVAGITFFASWYVMVIPITINSIKTWLTIIVSLAAGGFVWYALEEVRWLISSDCNSKNSGKIRNPFTVTAVVISALCILLSVVFSSRMFNAEIYAGRIKVETGNFAEDIPTAADLKNIPLMDSSTAASLGNRAIGDLMDVVSQYCIYPEEYSTIIYQGKVVKVAPLGYAGFWKWFKSHDNGIPGYVIVDPETSNAQYIKLDEPIRYAPSAYFSEDLIRHVRMKYPGVLIGSCMFQIDEEGTPVWTLMTAENKLIFDAWVPTGVIIVNASTGEMEMTSLEESPEWIDGIITGDEMLSLYNNYGLLSGGYLNSILSQAGCTIATNDYGYLAVGDDICYYTGVTSSVNDSSNLGFLIVNSRTCEFKYYPSPGADEHSAMRAAEGAMQNYGYKASFPSLINADGEPVYAMALKDTADLVKAYAFVNAENYSIVGTGTTLSEAMNNYRSVTGKSGYDLEEFMETENLKTESVETVRGTVRSVQYILLDGVTYTYLILEGNDKVYRQLFEESHILLSVPNAIADVTFQTIERETDIIDVIIKPVR